MSSPSAGPSGLSLEEQRALLREEQLRHVVDLMETSEDELLVQALDEVEELLEVSISPSIGKGYTTIVRPLERRSAVMGVRERIFRTRLEQQGRLDSRHQNINHVLAQGLCGAIETLVNDATIHDRDRMFLHFHSPRYDNSFPRLGGVRNQTW